MWPLPFEIYTARAKLGASLDVRPCVVLTEPDSPGRFSAFLLSSQFDLFDPGVDLVLEPSVDGFGQSGLRRRCYVIGSRCYELEVGELGKRIGRLEGKLLAVFLAWLG